MNEPVRDNRIFCPLCAKYFDASDYLIKNIKDDKVLWLANMVTHYRHAHISSWNKCWGRNGGAYRQKWFGEYEDEKKKVNERAKRQIIRKCQRYMNASGINYDHVEKLQANSSETLQFAKKLLNQEIMQELFR